MTGPELAKLRYELHMSQDQFAKRLDLSREYLSRIEKSMEPVSKKIQIRVNQIFAPVETSTVSHFLIPFYDIEATATPMDIFTKKSTIPHIDIDLPGFAGCDFAINVSGHSMYPAIESGSMILCKEINDKSLIMFGEIYLVVTEDYRMVKRLKKSHKKGFVIAASDNHNGHDTEGGKTYDNFELPINKIPE